MAVQALQYQQPPSWPQVLQAHRSWLYSVVFARLKDCHAVEEVLQETALAATKHINQTQMDSSSICRWLYRVAIRQTILYRRSRLRDSRKTALFQQETSKLQSTNPESLLIASENRELVQEAMQKLCQRDREVLMLKYGESWSCKEIGERLGASESAIKSRLLRARANLRKQLLLLEKNWGQT